VRAEGADRARIVSYAWDLEPPFLEYTDADTPQVNVTSLLRARGPGRYDVSLRVTDDLGNSDTDRTTITLVAGADDCEATCRTRIGHQLPGDANQDGRVDISDAVWLLRHLFVGIGELPCEGSEWRHPGSGDLALLDWNGDLVLSRDTDVSLNIGDPIAVLNWLFNPERPGHALGTACVAVPGCQGAPGCGGG
jgi:hypothetical protein